MGDHQRGRKEADRRRERPGEAERRREADVRLRDTGGIRRTTGHLPIPLATYGKHSRLPPCAMLASAASAAAASAAAEAFHRGARSSVHTGGLLGKPSNGSHRLKSELHRAVCKKKSSVHDGCTMLRQEASYSGG